MQNMVDLNGHRPIFTFETPAASISISFIDLAASSPSTDPCSIAFLQNTSNVTAAARSGLEASIG